MTHSRSERWYVFSSRYQGDANTDKPFVRDEAEILRVVGAQEEELNMIFIFELVDIDNKEGSFRMTLRDWHVREIKDMVSRYQRLMM